MKVAWHFEELKRHAHHKELLDDDYIPQYGQSIGAKALSKCRISCKQC